MWGLVALRLSDEEILPFNYSTYAVELEVTYRSVLKQI
jgi:N-acetylated-alpha-linked acidic dipeptidase